MFLECSLVRCQVFHSTLIMSEIFLRIHLAGRIPINQLNARVDTYEYLLCRNFVPFFR